MLLLAQVGPQQCTAQTKSYSGPTGQKVVVGLRWWAQGGPHARSLTRLTTSGITTSTYTNHNS